MRVIELIGEVDPQHRLIARVPRHLPVGPVRVIVLVPDAQEVDSWWTASVMAMWADGFTDPREDIYTLEDGEPVDPDH